MDKKRVLFISGSLGLGHVGRDIEIAKALRKIEPSVEISWLADYPASMVLENAGEKLLPEVRSWAHSNEKLDRSSKEYKANLVKWIMSMRQSWKANAQVVANVVEKEHFDLVVGDEAYEVLIERVGNPDFRNFKFVMIYDVIGLSNVKNSPVDALAAYLINRLWAKGLQAAQSVADRSLFIGEVADVPDEKFGFMLPNRRKLAIKGVDFVGYVLSFSPEQYDDKEKVRRLLGYGNEPLIVCSIGGTSAGKDLLILCSKAYPFMKKEIPELKMILVVVGGGTVTLELTALKRPFLYFPLKQHVEQEADVAGRCERHHAGVRMDFSKTTPELLAQEVMSNLDKKINYAPFPVDGAQNAALLISQVMNEKH
jgi:hypothetical protein